MGSAAHGVDVASEESCGYAAVHDESMTLFWRVFGLNAAVLVIAVAVLAVSPATVSDRPRFNEVLVLTLGVAVVLALNLMFMRRVFGPLERLTAVMRRIDPLAPGERVEVDHPAAEVAELSEAFNDMLERLERERRESGRRALAAQENERLRIARELHDQVGQTLTGVALQLETLERDAAPELRSSLRTLEASARTGVEEVREIVRRLRPEALDDFGLRSALVTLGSRLAEQSGIRVIPTLAGDLPKLAADDELVIYRVAQESLTNVVRHARARSAQLSLQAEDGAVVLRVRDDGRGIDAAGLRSGNGVRGMRERALLVGGELDVVRARPHGTEVRLRLPVKGQR
jgi:two-component system sensor histidine kinase UhpB